MHQPNPHRRRALAAAALLLTPTPAALAATVDWLPTAPTPAPFSDPAHWSTNAVPSPTDAARFDTGSAHTVTLTADTTTDQLLVASDDLALDLAGHTYTLANTTSTTPSLFLGSPAGSSLTLLNSAPAITGLLNISYATIAPAATDRADLTLSAGTSLNATGIDFNVAAYGSASLTLSPASTLTTRSTSFAGQPGSSAAISVAGPDARWNAYILQVAFSGSANLSVSGGASVDASGQLVMSAGRGGTATATVTGQGSALTAGFLSVGQLGTATLLVQDGAAVSSGGEFDIGRGTATIDGPASSLSAGYLFVGGYTGAGGPAPGSATLNVRGGSVSSVGALKLWNTQGTSVNLSGGSLKFAYADPSSDLSRFHWTGGTLELTNSAFQVSNPTTVTPASNYVFNAGPSLSLTPGMSLVLSSAPGHLNYLVVDNGGTLTADNTSISAGDGVYVGYASTGTLALSNHASLSTTGSGIIGYRDVWGGTGQRGAGTVTVDDHASWSLTSTLSVGGDGGGTLAVRGGSSVSNANADIAAGPIASSATVDGPGSSWSSSGTLTVGKLGQGTLTISNGGAVSSDTAIIGSSRTPDTSAVTIQGPGSSWTNTTTLYVAGGQIGNSSRVPASLALSDQASFTARTLVVASNSTSATGSVNLTSHATLAVTASAYLGGISTPRGTATLSLTDSSATVGTTLKLWDTPDTSLSLTRSALTIGTPAAPGALDNAASISLADHSTLTLHGTLANAGTLTLSPDSLLLWAPATSTPDPLSTLRTQLATHHIAASPSSPTTQRPAYTFSGEPTAPTSLTITLALTGDTNLDGRIDPDDYTLIDRSYARPLTNALWTDGDFNYDGIIDNQDYFLIDTAYAQAAPLSPAFLAARESQFGADYVSALLTSIPEPSSLACLFAGSLLLPRRRHR